MTETRGAKPGDRRALKNPDDVKAARLTIRCKETDRATWVSAAHAVDQKLAAWVTKQLNKGAS